MATTIFNLSAIDRIEADVINLQKSVNAMQASLANITNLLTQQGVNIMALTDDLNAAVAAIQAADQANQAADAAIQKAVNDAVALIQTLHTSGGGGSVADADVQAAIAALNAAASDNSAATHDYTTAATNLAAAQPMP